MRKIIRSLQGLSDNPVIRNFRELESDLNEFVHNYSIQESYGESEMSTILLEMKDIIIRHGLKAPAHFFLLARSLVTVEGVIRQLDPELDPLVHTINRISRQIVAAVIIAALIIGSSLMLVYNIPPLWKQVSFPGIAGFTIAALIALGMMKDMRRGDHDEWQGWNE